VPCNDGGISLGQAAIALNHRNFLKGDGNVLGGSRID
jgi:hypothetical protein